LPAILNGVKASAIICVALGTLAPLVADGGYGEDILNGIARGDSAVILRGVVPAFVMAATLVGVLWLAEKVAVPKGLRLKATFPADREPVTPNREPAPLNSSR
jgi:ABC-type proline/glycine betaine transport system permease subunit